MRSALASILVFGLSCGGASTEGSTTPEASAVSAIDEPLPDDPVDRALAILGQLDRDGWLDAFRTGQCWVLEPWETAPPESSPAVEDPHDVIGQLAELEPPRERSAECLAAAQRLELARSARDVLTGRDDRPGESSRLHRGIRALTPLADASLECPADDPDVFGAVLAVARYRAEMSFAEPVRLLATDRSCWVAGLSGPTWLDRQSVDSFFAAQREADAEAESVESDFPPAIAIDWVHDLCWSGIEGREDGCLARDPAPSCPGCPGSTTEIASTVPGTVTVFLVLERAAAGCGSAAVRSFEVARVAGEPGEWRVRSETLLAPGDHGQ